MLELERGSVLVGYFRGRSVIHYMLWSSMFQKNVMERLEKVEVQRNSLTTTFSISHTNLTI